MSVVGNLIGGVIGSNAADKAADQQTGASDRALALQKEIYDQSRADQMPWRTTGGNALGALATMLGVSTVAPPGTQQPATAGTPAAAQGDGQYTYTPGGGITGGPQAAGSGSTATTAWPTTQNTGLMPGATAMQQPGLPDFSAGAFQASPGYQFQLDQGLNAVNSQAGAQGMLGSGGRLKALTQYGQGLANQDYGNWFNRQTQQYNMANGQYTDYANRLAALAGVGQTANAQSAASGANYANQSSDIWQQRGQAAASGTVGSANAWNGTIGSIFGSGGGQGGLGSLFNLFGS